MNDRPASARIALARTEPGLQSHSAHSPHSPTKETTLSLVSLILGTFLLAATDCAVAQEVIETIAIDSRDRGRIQGDLDWSERSLLIFGEAVAPAEVTSPVQARLLGFRAAKLVAYRNLLELVGEVQIDGQTTVSMAMVSDDSIRTRVEGIVSGARVVPGSREQEGDIYRITLQLDLLGDLADTVLPVTDSATPPENALPTELPESDSLLVFMPPQPFTGLIIDARGLDLSPSMSPRIIDTADRLIYGAEQIDRNYAVRRGIVGYLKDMIHAAVSDRLGGSDAHPLVVDAVEVSGLYNSDVVVDRENGVRIRMADMEADFLSQCRVIFLVGPAPPQVEPVHYDSLLMDPLSESALDDDLLDDILDGVPDDADSLDSILEAEGF